MTINIERLKTLERESALEPQNNQGLLKTPRSFMLVEDLMRSWLYGESEDRPEFIKSQKILLELGVLIEEPQDKTIVTPFSMTSSGN